VVESIGSMISMLPPPAAPPNPMAYGEVPCFFSPEIPANAFHASESLSSARTPPLVRVMASSVSGAAAIAFCNAACVRVFVARPPGVSVASVWLSLALPFHSERNVFVE
jgi:hypothetical protein